MFKYNRKLSTVSLKRVGKKEPQKSIDGKTLRCDTVTKIYEFIEVILKHGQLKAYFIVSSSSLKQVNVMARDFLSNNGIFVPDRTNLILMKHDYYSANILQVVKQLDDVEHGCIIEIIICETIETYTNGIAHSFKIMTYKHVTFCDFCNRLLDGFTNQGIECQSCFMNFHRACSKKIDQLCLCNVVNINRRETDYTENKAEKLVDLTNNIERRRSIHLNAANAPQPTITSKHRSVFTLKSKSKNSMERLPDSVNRSKTFKQVGSNKFHHQFKSTRETSTRVCYVCLKKFTWRSKALECTACLIIIHVKCYDSVATRCVADNANNFNEKLDFMFKNLDTSSKITAEEDTKKNVQTFGTISKIKMQNPLRRINLKKELYTREYCKVLFRGKMKFSFGNDDIIIVSQWILDEKKLIIYDNYKENKVFRVFPHDSIKQIQYCEACSNSKANISILSHILCTTKGNIIFGDKFEKYRHKFSINTGTEFDGDYDQINEIDTWVEFFQEICIRNKEEELGENLEEDLKEDFLNAQGRSDAFFHRFYSFDKKDVLGVGQFGKVYKGRKISTNKVLAIKTIRKDKYNSAELELFSTEFKLVHDLDHPGIITAEMFVQTSKYLYIVMECLSGDMLNMIIQSETRKLTEFATKFILYQILVAISYLHSKFIAHCDIKPENILISSNVSANEHPQIKLCDFGFARVLNPGEKCKATVGTPAYIAPEVLEGRSFDSSIDIWSTGVIAYVSLSGTFPFEEDQSIYDQIVSYSGMFPHSIWCDISKEGIDFILYLLNVDPKIRPSAEVILYHSWFKEKQLIDELITLEEVCQKKLLFGGAPT